MMKSNGCNIVRLIVAVVMVACGTTCIDAQNNRFGINDELFAIYDRCDKNIMSETLQQDADVMLEKSRAMGDKKAECLAWCIKSRALSSYEHSTVDEARKYIHELRKVSEDYGYSQYYYYSYLLEADKLINAGMTLEALHVASEMRDRAYDEKSAYGIYSCHIILGNIYTNRAMYRSALKEYEEALLYREKNLPDQSSASALYYCTICLNKLGRNKEVIEYADQVLADPTSSARLCLLVMAQKCMAEYQMGDKELFRKQYAEYEQYMKDSGLDETVGNIELPVFHYIVDGEYETAKDYVAHKVSPNRVARLMSLLYRAKGEYKTAYIYLDTVRNNLLESFDDSFNDDLANLDALLEHEKLQEQNNDLEIERKTLEVEKRRLEMEKSQLELDRKRLEIDNSNTTIELQTMLLENKGLELNNKTMQLEQQNKEIEHRKELIDQEKSKNEMSKRIVYVMGLSMSLVILIIIVMFWFRERMYRNLTKMNEELSDARHKAEESRHRAEQSETRKSLFIQSMSHEVRTPLNAICGFSQLLADPEILKGMDTDQRNELITLIRTNTDLLITIVNDILYVSDLESGKKKMNIKEWSCVELCKNALRSVIDKKKPGVELTFSTNVDKSFTVLTDGECVNQLLTNMLMNSIKYTEKGEICLSCILDDDNQGYMTFSVTDTGIGIPKEKADVVFERFEKLDKFTQGTGLGLYICKLVSERLNGKVYLDTEYTGGARFVFLHPFVVMERTSAKRGKRPNVDIGDDISMYGDEGKDISADLISNVETIPDERKEGRR